MDAFVSLLTKTAMYNLQTLEDEKRLISLRSESVGPSTEVGRRLHVSGGVHLSRGA